MNSVGLLFKWILKCGHLLVFYFLCLVIQNYFDYVINKLCLFATALTLLVTSAWVHGK